MQCPGCSSLISQKLRLIEERTAKLEATVGEIRGKSEKAEFEKETLIMKLMLLRSRKETGERRQLWDREGNGWLCLEGKF
jgi:hypothetical protein